MKRTLTIVALILMATAGFSQQVASRAKAMRMMSFSRPEYLIKDIKVYTDTMTVYSLAGYIIYPFGEWSSVEQYITDNQLSWYRDIGYKKYYDSMEVSVNRLRRYDDSYIDVYYSIWTKSYTSDVTVLKVVSGAGEVAEIYTFRGQKLKHIKIETAYKYY